MSSPINPAKIQSVLQQATDQQLMQMLKRPDKIPSMFIQQEIARRRQMRQAAEADLSKTGTLMMPARQPEMAYRQPHQVTQQPRLMHSGGRPHSHNPFNIEYGDRGDPRMADLSFFPNIKGGVYAANPALAYSQSRTQPFMQPQQNIRSSKSLGFLPLENIPTLETVKSPVTKFGNRNQRRMICHSYL